MLSPPTCFKRGILLLVTVLFLLLTLAPLSVGAVAEAAPADNRIGSAYVCNLENNVILYEKEVDTKIFPSSSVKIMTGLLACRELEGRLDEEVTVTAAMVDGLTGRRMHLADGEILTVRDLLYSAICGSYNDAACVLACLVSGSVSAFVGDMNKEAQRLNTSSTVYTNATGLHDPAMSTSVRDVAIIARAAYENDLYREISSARSYTVPATNVTPERFFSNRNQLISDSTQNYHNGYCRGLNAGMTDEGGWCVVTVCERGGAENLCIVMQGKDVDSDELIPAYVYTNKLLAWATRNFTYRTILSAGETLDTAPVGMTGISKSKADLVPTEDLRVYLPTDVAADAALTITPIIDGGKLVAPLSAGDVVGIVTVSYQGRVVGKADLTITEDFERNGFMNAMMGFRGYLTGRAFWITVAVFVVSLLLFLRATSGPRGRYGIRSAKRRRVRYRRRRY